MPTDKQAEQRPGRGSLVIHFEGPALSRNTLLLRDFILFCRQVQTALDRVSLILRGYSESVQPGRRLSEVESASSLEVVSFTGGGSANLEVRLPPVEQAVLPTYADPGTEALDALMAGLDAISEDPEQFPAGYDAGVLLSLREAGKLFEHDVERITFRTSIGRKAGVHAFDKQTVARIVRRVQSPTQNQRTVEGRLLMADFREANRRCRVHPAVGEPVTCSFDESTRDLVLASLTHIVRVVGQATEVEGEIQSLHVQDIDVLDGGVVPGPLGLQLTSFGERIPSLEELSREQEPRTVSDLMVLAEGLWPEDEDVEEFIQTVRRWRREGGGERSL